MYNPLDRSKQILGINARNLDYIRANNPKEERQLVDSKLRTKRLLRNSGIPVMDTYAVIHSVAELDDFNWNTLPNSFVIKPNKGFGGSGIIILFGEKKNKHDPFNRVWIASNGEELSIQDLSNHILNILEGYFSKSRNPDTVILEQRVRNIPLFKEYVHRGIPDIRVVVYNKIPVMAELRLPTKISNGKSNLHAGGVGVGIDIATGITTHAVQYDKLIDVHPDSKKILSGIRIPRWNKILDIAVSSQIVSGLGYIGIDIAYDKERGPVVLELNARPGLAIQIANKEGLASRLSRTKGLKIKTKERGISIAKGLFGGEIEEEIEEISGKQVLGRIEEVMLLGKNNKEESVKAKIDTGAYASSLDTTLAQRLGYKDAIKYFNSFHFPNNISLEEARKICNENQEQLSNHPDIVSIAPFISSHGVSIRPIIDLQVKISGDECNLQINLIDRSELTYSMIIGRKDLGNFLIDVTKTYNS